MNDIGRENLIQPDELLMAGPGSFMLSMRGPRVQNEDWCGFRAYPQNNAFAVVLCDGVGGLQGGAKASRFLTDATLNALEEPYTGPLDEAFVNKLTERLHRDLCNGIEVAKASVEDAPASTWCLVYVRGNEALLTHMGDSRIYLFRRKEQLFVSRDHSIVNEMLDQQVITEEEAKTHRLRNVITRAFQVNPERSDNASFRSMPLQGDEVIVLCSDGFLPVLEEMIPLNPATWQVERTLRAISRNEDKLSDNLSLCYINLSDIDYWTPSAASGSVQSEPMPESKPDSIEESKSQPLKDDDSLSPVWKGWLGNLVTYFLFLLAGILMIWLFNYLGVGGEKKKPSGAPERQEKPITPPVSRPKKDTLVLERSRVIISKQKTDTDAKANRKRPEKPAIQAPEQVIVAPEM